MQGRQTLLVEQRHCCFLQPVGWHQIHHQSLLHLPPSFPCHHLQGPQGTRQAQIDRHLPLPSLALPPLFLPHQFLRVFQKGQVLSRVHFRRQACNGSGQGDVIHTQRHPVQGVHVCEKREE